MCRTVADAAALLGVLAGETYGEGSGPDTLRGVRLAVPPEPGDLHEQDRRGVPRGARRAPRAWRGPRRGAARCRRPTRPRCCSTSSPATSTPTSRPCPRAHRSGPCASSSRGTTRTPTRRSSSGRRCSSRRWPSTTTPSARPTSVRGPRDLAVAGEHGIDATLAAADAAAIVFPGRTAAGSPRGPATPAWSCRRGTAARTAGRSGLSFVGPSRSEGLLLSLGAAYEEAAQVRRPPSVVNPSLFSAGVAGSPATG